MNLFICVLPAKVLTDGTHKVRIAMSHNSETRYVGTRFKVPSPKNIKNGRVTGKEIGNAEYINLQLNKKIQDMYRAYDSIPNAECYTCSQLLALIENKLHKYVPIYFDEIASEWLEYKRPMVSDNSIKVYNTAIKTFSGFVGEKFLFSTLNEKLVFEYDHYLSNRAALKKNGEPIGKNLANATINIRMNTLMAITRYAEKKHYVMFDENPFDSYELRQETIRDLFLDVATIRKIRDYKTDDYDIQLCRDFFMLSFYLAGMNLNDMLRLDFSGDNISFMRGKTKSNRRDGLETIFTIQPEARAIINKYIGKDNKLHIKNKTNNSTINNYLERHLHKFDKLVNPRVHIIFYCARKSFSQFANELGVRDSIIKYCICDAMNKTEKGMLMYYTKTTQQMADEAIRCVLDFVASNRSESSLFQTSESMK